MQPVDSSQALGSESGVLSTVLVNEHPPLQPSRQVAVLIFVVVAVGPILQNSHVEYLLWCAKPSCATKTYLGVVLVVEGGRAVSRMAERNCGVKQSFDHLEHRIAFKAVRLESVR